MSSRSAILSALRRNKPLQTPLPALTTGTETPAEELEHSFLAALEFAGGRFLLPSPGANIAQAIAAAYPDERSICSAVPELVPGTIGLHQITDPHDLSGVDLFVCRGTFGVAENAAVWVDERQIGHRAAPFLAQHLAIVLDRNAIVPNMHAAYARLTVNESGFGVFIAGPSKTADIEQALVIGAHGPRSLTIVLTDESQSDLA
jgi:L-lactate dehydrogenase complex protein LldG